MQTPQARWNAECAGQERARNTAPSTRNRLAWQRMALTLGARLACLLLALTMTHAEAQVAHPPLVDLATAYVHRFVDAFSNVVAEELYTQRTTSPQRRRVLRSEFLLVRYPGAAEWHAFRDVLEVD